MLARTGETTMDQDELCIGDRVKCTDAYEQIYVADNDRGDVGRVLGFDKDAENAYIGWSSGIRTWMSVKHLELAS
jgi:hypothetical protein